MPKKKFKAGPFCFAIVLFFDGCIQNQELSTFDNSTFGIQKVPTG